MSKVDAVREPSFPLVDRDHGLMMMRAAILEIDERLKKNEELVQTMLTLYQKLI